ncbi:hypothetical protein E3P81_00069 [Wallemia ichthyophaga]|nr:hypothetical protein E3P97_00099 [Wallemia ichthyophaga]TIB05213.1 hypothetical protein E3P96_01320 [Wallemia ichthyophaga]TIB36230.1 hypothetical protein E3P85_00070 [Wallemia ichthyophaga]TIB51472.1 hypothetical protein E3P82_00099 [Wallemia ichthyophaga]TIB54637.1 hypothetical protein E3P81_00069 [Wallemia ichthyophaga]
MEKSKKLSRPPSLSELVSRIDTDKINQVKLQQQQRLSDERRYAARKILTRQENTGVASASSTPNKHSPSLAKIQSRFGVSEDIQDHKEKKDDVDLHPLQHCWTLFYDSKTSNTAPTNSPQQLGHTDKGTYEAGLNVIQDMKTVEDFCRVWNWCKPPSKLERHSNYHLFKDGIKPLWEDPSNSNGGKWVIIVRNSHWLLDRCWTWLVMGLIGEEIDEDDDITGAVVSTRPRGDRIQIWTRMTSVDKCNQLAEKLIKMLEIDQDNNKNISLDFQFNQSNPPPTTEFINITPTQSSNSPSTTTTQNSPGDFKIPHTPHTPQDRWRSQ